MSKVESIKKYTGASNKAKSISDALGEDIDVYDFQLDASKTKAVVIYANKKE